MYSQTARNSRNFDRLLFNVLEEEYHYGRTQTPRKHLRFSNMVDDQTAEIALLTHVQGMTNARAAETCGTSSRTVNRAKAHFEDVLRELAR